MSQVTPISNIHNSIPMTEMFRPVTSNVIIVDDTGNTWKQITALGWQRQFDQFFWPFNPTNCDNVYNCLPPTIKEIEISRSK